ncbi:MAG: GNAT family N-acetyltransferase [Clostridia bacterium]|nr:GNAT family N-acetyltransferase [Clostridia bacterium]
MIRKIKEQQHCEILNILRNSYIYNPYLYIDAVSFGFSGKRIETYICYEKDEIVAIIYEYYNSLQICSLKEDIQVAQIVEFVKKGDFNMISGNASIIKKLEVALKDFYVAHFGYIMMFPKNGELSQIGNSEMAQVEDCGEIARLICSDEDIGGHYTQDILQKQLEERMLCFGCKNVIIKEQGEIIAHAATYADCSEFAIIGGVITNPYFRGKGYGGNVVSYLTKQLLLDGKNPLLYCYDPKTVKWYEKNSWEICTQCGKLERKRNAL